MVNSKSKGSEYERKVAKILGSWWGEEFHRTPMSGGLHWHEDNRVSGDIVTPPGSLYPFTTECKKREGWSFEQILKGTGEVEEWWKQSTGDSKRVGLLPLVVFAKNFSPNYMMLTESVFNSILKYKGTETTPFNYFILHRPKFPTRVVCVLDEFIKFVTKDDVIGALAKEK